MLEPDLSLPELEKAFTTSKPNKGEGLDEINVRSVFDIIKNPLLFIFSISLKQGISPESLQSGWVVSVFKSEDRSTLSNYRSISILTCL